MLLVIIYLVVFTISFVVMYLSRKTDSAFTVATNPNFITFQKGYFVAYLTALFADWLHSPYRYKLYSHYGFEEDQIATLYVCGFASTVILGSWAPIVADRFGRKKLCIIFTVIYSVTSLMKLSSSYFVLLVGSILDGIATSLLFSAFESWYMHEHVETHDFPKEWIEETFDKVGFWNGLLAIVAGFVANAFANLSPVSPFIVSIPFLLIVGVFISVRWTENCSPVQPKIHKSCMDGLREIMKDQKIFLAGMVQSLFESTMYIFVFIWTPVVDEAHVPLGLTFSSFMACTVIGSACFVFLHRQKYSVAVLLASSVILAAIGNSLAAFATHPSRPWHFLSLTAFFLIEFSVGMYFRSMTVIRAQVVPQATRNAINSWFRVPLNLIACIILMSLHNDVFRHRNRLIFVSCAILLFFASIFVTCLVSLIRRDSDFTDLTTNGARSNGVNSQV